MLVHGYRLSEKEAIAVRKRLLSFQGYAQQEFFKGFKSGLLCDDFELAGGSEMFRAGFSDGYWLAQSKDNQSIDVLGSWEYEQ